MHVYIVSMFWRHISRCLYDHLCHPYSLAKHSITVTNLLRTFVFCTRLFRQMSTKKKKIRRADISGPSNFEHRVHTGYDPVRCTYVGLPAQWTSVVEPIQAGRPRPIVDPSITTPVKVRFFHSAQHFKFVVIVCFEMYPID